MFELNSVISVWETLIWALHVINIFLSVETVKAKRRLHWTFSLRRHSCCRQAGRQGTLVTTRQANHWDLPFPLVCLPSRSLHFYTQTTTTHINTHHWSPLRRSISQDHTASSGSQALLTRSADGDSSFTQPDSWPCIITGVRGAATPRCSSRVWGWAQGGSVLPRLHRYWQEPRFIFFFFLRPNVKR